MDAAFERYDIQEIPLSSPLFCKSVETFLADNGLSMERMDCYLAIQDEKGAILAGAGLAADVVKGVAVSRDYRSEGLLAPLISRLIAKASDQGVFNLKVFTKPEYQPTFESLGFRLLAHAPEAIFMENGKGLEQYCAYLRGLRRPGRCGVIVMNANPFTLGHQYLVRKALEQVQQLFVIPIREDNVFPYAERLEMIRAGVAEFGERVVVAEGSAYCISVATFPTYFLKELSSAAETQMRLDINLFSRHIAPALGAAVRFVGSEPADDLTARYNVLLRELLPEVVEITRLQTPDRASRPVSASAVRAALKAGSFQEAAALTPASTHPYLLAALAERALRLELDAPLKPGLVCPDTPGAHHDMDYALMQKGIAAIRPFFAPMALARDPQALRQLGIDAEKAMLTATGGINTHRGAIFALGLALNAALQVLCSDSAPHDRGTEVPDFKTLMQRSLVIDARGVSSNHLVNNNLRSTPFPIKGAREMALDGYKILFQDWLPFFRDNKSRPDALQRTLLLIMASLDDTCILKRVGYDRAQQVKAEASKASGVPETVVAAGAELQELCNSYAEEGISPGGAADMLALTIFIDSITS